MDIEHHEQIDIPRQQELRYGIPYDTRPMEGELGLGQKVVFHGGIALCNHTERPIAVREDFLLHRGGYHLTIFDLETGEMLLTAPSPMNTAYFFIKLEDGYFLEKLPPNT